MEHWFCLAFICHHSSKYYRGTGLASTSTPRDIALRALAVRPACCAVLRRGAVRKREQAPPIPNASRNSAAAQQRLVNKKKAISDPVRIKPSTPARRSLLSTTPSKLKMKPSGVATSKVNPPRVVMGEPQPGRNSSMAA